MDNLDIYEVSETKRNFEIEGISDTVTRFSTSELKVPCIKLISKEKNPPIYKLQILNNMVIKANGKLYNNSENTVMIYLRDSGGGVVECGKIYQSQIKPLLKLFEEDCEIRAIMNNNTELKGHYVYAMCV